MAEAAGLPFSVGAPASFAASLVCRASEHLVVRNALVERCHKAVSHVRSLRGETVTNDPASLRIRVEVVGCGRVDRTVERLLTSLSSFDTVCSLAWSRTDQPETDVALSSSG